MSIPTWVDLNVPVLRALESGETLTVRQIRRRIIEDLQMTPEQINATHPSGQPVFVGRVSWSLSYLNRIDAINSPKRAHYEIAPLGKALLLKYPDRISEAVIRENAKPDDHWWKNRGKSKAEIIDETHDDHSESEKDPTEQIETGVQRIEEGVNSELLSRLLERDPEFFEDAVMALLLKMGYGGIHGSGRSTPRGKDGGIDGIINQDALGLHKVYIQAKRYNPENAVGRPIVQAFIGALSGTPGGGIFITTGRFSREARDFITRVNTPIVLVDGQELAELMIQHRVGVEVKQTFEIVGIDEDFFE